MRRLLSIVLLAACGGGGQPEPAAPQPMGPQPTEMQRRQTAACEALGPRLTRCAYDSAKKNLTPEQFEKEQVEEKVGEHTKLVTDECLEQQMSSRQLRVYEVCMREEQECGPLIDCLENAKPKPAK